MESTQYTGALESAYAIKTGNKVYLSEQNLVDCSSLYGNSGCHGGVMEYAFNVFKASGYKTMPHGDEKALKKAVATVGPVAVGINGDFLQHYAGGIFSEGECDRVPNHGMLVVGYGSFEGTPYWILKNSWGPSWGEDGYMKMIRVHHNQCGIADAASYPTQNHGKQYRNLREEQTRYSIFQENLRKVEAHNELYAKGEKTYFMGVTAYSDLSREEYLALFNATAYAELDMEMEAATSFEDVSASAAALPDSIDWRDQGVVGEVKSQASCGGCWAFSATGAMESHYAISKQSLILLSEQYLIDCTIDIGNHGCTGGTIHRAFQYSTSEGVEKESDYPYQAVDSTCGYDATKIVYKLSGYTRVTSGSESALQQAVAIRFQQACYIILDRVPQEQTTKGPVSTSVNADYFQLYAGGVLDEASCSQTVTHGVLIVGYGTEDGVDYWLIKNSWGATWGENGYLKMARNKSGQCGIDLYAVYPVI
ncbi:hypothetical protein NQ318_004757 [Aromia moschata]|uniref:Cathepsin L n=1 Tax=Aromia moschata TaxID=1265417 RepID=A0AAV8XZL6_9CUCU|nr:hypothetical protein NQ318_004757 [Aromia moschata]